jgi:hypothetical protein
MVQGQYPTLYQINTRIWLGELSRQMNKAATLADVPDACLDQFARAGFDWLWLLGVWQNGAASKAVSLSQPRWRSEYRNTLPDFSEDDVCGSPFAVRSYVVDKTLGGPEALQELRERLQRRGIRLLLDFVPNHTALDHPWIFEHPEYYINATEAQLAAEPQNYRRIDTKRGPRNIGYGRDPFFAGWPDTAQLNYRHAGLRAAMQAELCAVARQCDGVRCDMAMLILPEVIQRTWGDLSRPADGSEPVDAPFWPETIAHIRQETQDFLFMAKVYWDLEWALQQQGFDYTYDKRLYDRLHARDADAARKHLFAEMDFQRKLARFLESHDEPRAASAFPAHVLKAAATITYLIPGMRLFHDGQLEGRKIRAGVHLNRRPIEEVDADLQAFYGKLLDCTRRPEVRRGQWRLLHCQAAWEGNATWDRFIAFSWDGPNHERMLVAVNYGPTPGQCYVHRAFTDLPGKKWRLHDLLSGATYQRDRESLAQYGLYLELPEWGQHVFELSQIE